MDPIKKNQQLLEFLSRVQQLIEKKEWDDALIYLKALQKGDLEDQKKSIISIIRLFENFVSGMILFEKKEFETALERFITAFNSIPEDEYDALKSRIKTKIGLLYLEANNKNGAEMQRLERWTFIKGTRNSALMLELLDELIPISIKLNNQQDTIYFLKEKLPLIKKEVDETEYVKIVILLITYLLNNNEVEEVFRYFEEIKNLNYSPIHRLKDEIDKRVGFHNFIQMKNYNKALHYIISHNFQLEPYLPQFETLINSFKNSPSPEFAKTLLKIFNYQVTQPEAQRLIQLWKREIYLKFEDIIKENVLQILDDESYKSFIAFYLKENTFRDQILTELSRLTEILAENPHEKQIMKFLLNLNQNFFNQGEEAAAQKIHSWIQATLAIRKPKLAAATIYHIYRESKATYAPIFLIKKFFKDNYENYNNKATVALCNELSEFLGEISVIIYDLPDFSFKKDILDTVDLYSNTVASGFEYLLLRRMKQQKANDIFSLNPLAPIRVVNALVSGFTRNNSLPFTRCLENTIERWNYFPRLRMVSYSYYGPQYTVMRPVLWFIIFQIIYAQHLQDTHRQLPKNEALHHKNLVDLVRAHLNFFYRLRQCLRDESSAPISLWRGILNAVIQFLKQMNNMIHFTDDELREMVELSHWEPNSKQILAKVIEAKNYCIYCSYNMPEGSKKCPNCSREVDTMPTGEPTIDLSSMESFFASSDTSPEPPEPKPLKICPQCGSPVSTEDDRCIRCGNLVE